MRPLLSSFGVDPVPVAGFLLHQTTTLAWFGATKVNLATIGNDKIQTCEVFQVDCQPFDSSLSLQRTVQRIYYYFCILWIWFYTWPCRCQLNLLQMACSLAQNGNHTWCCACGKMLKGRHCKRVSNIVICKLSLRASICLKRSEGLTPTLIGKRLVGMILIRCCGHILVH